MYKKVSKLIEIHLKKLLYYYHRDSRYLISDEITSMVFYLAIKQTQVTLMNSFREHDPSVSHTRGLRCIGFLIPNIFANTH